MSASDSDLSSSAATDKGTWQEFFIDLVKAHPVLYDKSHRDFNDAKGAKLNTWRTIVAEMKSAGFENLGGTAQTINTETLISKWVNLRDSFKKWLRADEKARRCGAGDKDLPKRYKHADQLFWLKDPNKRARSETSSVSSTALPPVTPSEPMEDCTLPKSVYEASGSSTTSPPLIVTSITSQQAGRKRLHVSLPTSHISTEAIQDTQKSSGYIAQTASKKPNTRTDDDIFVEMVAGQLKAIPDGAKKEYAKLQIHRILFELKNPDYMSTKQVQNSDSARQNSAVEPQQEYMQIGKHWNL